MSERCGTEVFVRRSIAHMKRAHDAALGHSSWRMSSSVAVMAEDDVHEGNRPCVSYRAGVGAVRLRSMSASAAVEYLTQNYVTERRKPARPGTRVIHAQVAAHAGAGIDVNGSMLGRRGSAVQRSPAMVAAQISGMVFFCGSSFVMRDRASAENT